MSNFDYLCILNKYSGRTYQDMNQYPVFPWVLAEYKTSSLNLEDKKFFRNLAFPVSIQSETKRKYIMQKYESENDNQVHFSKYHLIKDAIMRLHLLLACIFSDYNHLRIVLLNCKIINLIMLIGFSIIWAILILFLKTYLITENLLLSSSIVLSF